MNKILKGILIAITILIIIAVVIIIQINRNIPNNDNNNIISEEEASTHIKNEIETTKKEILSDKTEATRIKNYIGQFYTQIDIKEYNNAYNMLFDSFKENYFKTEIEFEEYVKSKYPKKLILNHTKLDREGKYYIATVEVIDALNTQNKFTQRIVVEETELNKFNISFQVI